MVPLLILYTYNIGWLKRHNYYASSLSCSLSLSLSLSSLTPTFLQMKSSFAKTDKRHPKIELFTPPCGLYYLVLMSKYFFGKKQRSPVCLPTKTYPISQKPINATSRRVAYSNQPRDGACRFLQMNSSNALSCVYLLLLCLNLFFYLLVCLFVFCLFLFFVFGLHLLYFTSTCLTLILSSLTLSPSPFYITPTPGVPGRNKRLEPLPPVRSSALPQPPPSPYVLAHTGV